jgi:hypothetical protein
MIGKPVSNILPYALIDFGIPTSFASVFFEMIYQREISKKKSISGFGWKSLIYSEILLICFENYNQSDLV